MIGVRRNTAWALAAASEERLLVPMCRMLNDTASELE